MSERFKPKANKSDSKEKNIGIKFDKEGLLLSFGIGITSFAVGLMIVWGTLTAPDTKTNTTGFTVLQRLAHQIPEPWQEKIALVMGFIFMLFGFFIFLLGIKLVIHFICNKSKSTT